MVAICSEYCSLEIALRPFGYIGVAVRLKLFKRKTEQLNQAMILFGYFLSNISILARIGTLYKFDISRQTVSKGIVFNVSYR